jgi:hypothetical protein
MRERFSWVYFAADADLLTTLLASVTMALWGLDDTYTVERLRRLVHVALTQTGLKLRARWMQVQGIDDMGVTVLSDVEVRVKSVYRLSTISVPLQSSALVDKSIRYRINYLMGGKIMYLQFPIFPRIAVNSSNYVLSHAFENSVEFDDRVFHMHSRPELRFRDIILGLHQTILSRQTVYSACLGFGGLNIDNFGLLFTS